MSVIIAGPSISAIEDLLFIKLSSISNEMASLGEEDSKRIYLKSEYEYYNSAYNSLVYNMVREPKLDFERVMEILKVDGVDTNIAPVFTYERGTKYALFQMLDKSMSIFTRRDGLWKFIWPSQADCEDSEAEKWHTLRDEIDRKVNWENYREHDDCGCDVCMSYR